jgi:hypothetical protein
MGKVQLILHTHKRNVTRWCSRWALKHGPACAPAGLCTTSPSLPSRVIHFTKPTAAVPSPSLPWCGGGRSAPRAAAAGGTTTCGRRRGRRAGDQDQGALPAQAHRGRLQQGSNQTQAPGGRGQAGKGNRALNLERLVIIRPYFVKTVIVIYKINGQFTTMPM